MKAAVASLVLAGVVSLTSTAELTASGKNCSRTEDCGWRAECDATRGQCMCDSGYVLHTNGKDCLNNECSAVTDCVECSSKDVCVRCVLFISKDNGQCLSRCLGQAEILEDGPYQGNVCTESAEKTEVIIAVVAGVAAGLLLCTLIALGICFYIRRTRLLHARSVERREGSELSQRKNINLQEKDYKSRELEMGKVKQIPVYDNKGFESESQMELRASGVDPTVYLHQLEELRPHTETLMTVLSQIRRKLRSMDQADPRVPTYKGVIHQLCRVLVLLHKKDPTVSIPSDALGLIEWAQQMLEDHREQEDDDQTMSVGTAETPISKISYIDVDFKNPNSPVYATPMGGGRNPQPLSHSGTSGYYSSVPVPIPEMNNVGYATINRTPANPSAFNSNKNNLPKSGSVKKVNNTKSRTRVVTNAGYFANGRYYDPSPQPVVYAPASSYSDRSAGPLSTFTGDMHRPQSFSASDNSNSGSRADDEDDERLSDGFPFDPRDATDPVEV